jgi:hypothetical protein
VGLDLLIFEVSRSHSELDTPHSVGIFWTSEQPDAATATFQHTALTRQMNIHDPDGIRTRNPKNERPQTHALDREATGIDPSFL